MKAPRAGLMAALAPAVLALSRGSARAAAGDLDPTFDGVVCGGAGNDRGKACERRRSL